MSIVVKWKKPVIKFCLFILARFPFINALTLLMLLGERAAHESYPPLNPKVIYLHLGLFVVCGALMSAFYQAKSMALIYAGQLLYFSYNAYTNTAMGQDWLRVLIASRHFACAGVYLGIAYLTDQASGKQLRHISYAVLGAYSLSIIMTLNDNQEAYLAFTRHFPLADVTYFLMMVILGVCAVALFSGPTRFLCRAFFVLSLLLILMSFFIDCRLSYWTNWKKVHYWNVIRLIADQICIVLGLVLFGFHHYPGGTTKIKS